MHKYQFIQCYFGTIPTFLIYKTLWVVCTLTHSLQAPHTAPALVEMMGFLGMGNNPMVGATVAIAVAIQQAMN